MLPFAMLELRILRLTLLLLILGLNCVDAVTVYNQQPYGATDAATATATTYAAYNTSTLAAPAPPNEPTKDFTLELQSSSDGVSGLGIQQTYGNLWGFSIEMSVINQVSEYHDARANPCGACLEVGREGRI